MQYILRDHIFLIWMEFKSYRFQTRLFPHSYSLLCISLVINKFCIVIMHAYIPCNNRFPPILNTYNRDNPSLFMQVSYQQGQVQ